MQLSKIIKNLKPQYRSHFFSNLSSNSKDCKKDDIFFSIKGKRHNGNKFIKDAINRGARTIVSSTKPEKLKNGVLYLYNNNPRRFLAECTKSFYKKKPKNIVAVTGTNGKTSISDFYYQILKLCKKPVCSIGTLGVKTQNFKRETINTTLDNITLNKLLEKLHKKKINNVILEASSHGLHQYRLHGIDFQAGIFTNLTRDHLDYHKTFKNYLNAKIILFKNLLKKNGVIVFSRNTKPEKILRKISKERKIKKLILGKNSDFEITRHMTFPNLQKIQFKYKNKKYFFKTKLLGEIQVTNLMMALMVASQIIPLKKILKVIPKVKPISGRLEIITELKNKSVVILDYSHTPDALETCLSNVNQQYKFSKISLVFGCGGERDKQKREIMGRIANKYCNKIYLTDDNPRNENPKFIRKQIMKKIQKHKIIEIASRKKAIKQSINDLECGDVLIVAGKGHEQYQEYNKKIKFSDELFIKYFSKIKNKTLSKYWKNNILSETLRFKKINSFNKIDSATINSKNIKKNQVFFGLKGKRLDGGKYVDEAIKKNAVVSIINKQNKNKSNKIVKVDDSLKAFSLIASKIRMVSKIKTIAITGSAGKTSLKELLGQTLSKFSRTVFSDKSYNNKFGVPLSLFNIGEEKEFGIFEVGMDKAGEINKLAKIIKPDVGVITNISYAHIKNFKNLKGIATAKSELIDQINKDGTMILNKDCNFFKFFKNKALKKKLNIVTFGIKNKADFSVFSLSKKNKKKYLLTIKHKNNFYKFYIYKSLISYLENIIAAIAAMSIYFKIDEINKNVFLNFNIPQGRGNISQVNFNNNKINLVDESYNSNPLSLKFAIENLDSLNAKNKMKIAILGDMLELGNYSRKLHVQISKHLNKSNIDKVYVYGKYIKHTFDNLKKNKKGKIFKSVNEVKNFLNNDLRHGEFLMVKGSNSTGLNKILREVKIN